MRLELFGSDAVGKSYLLNEIGIVILIALVVVNVYGFYFIRKNERKKKKILTWWIVLDALLLIGMLFFGIVIRTTFQ